MKDYLLAVVLRDPVVIRLREIIENKYSRIILYFVFLFPAIVRYLLSCLYEKILSSNKSTKKDFAIVLIIKNEADYIAEFIKYHTLIGVNDFIIFDNESTDITAEIVNKITWCNIHYHYLKGKQRQIDAYNIALKEYRNDYKYLIFLDADEFLFAVDGDALLHIQNLMAKPGVGGIGINWVLFGSSGFKSRDRKALVTTTFLNRSELDFKLNNHVKTICNTERIISMINAHYGVYKYSFNMYDCGGNIINGAFTKIPQNSSLRINHYFTKSYDEFLEKRNRGKADSGGIRNMNDFKVHDLNDVYDDSMLVYRDVMNQSK